MELDMKKKKIEEKKAKDGQNRNLINMVLDGHMREGDRNDPNPGNEQSPLKKKSLQTNAVSENREEIKKSKSVESEYAI